MVTSGLPKSSSPKCPRNSQAGGAKKGGWGAAIAAILPFSPAYAACSSGAGQRRARSSRTSFCSSATLSCSVPTLCSRAAFLSRRRLSSDREGHSFSISSRSASGTSGGPCSALRRRAKSRADSAGAMAAISRNRRASATERAGGPARARSSAHMSAGVTGTRAISLTISSSPAIGTHGVRAASISPVRCEGSTWAWKLGPWITSSRRRNTSWSERPASASIFLRRCNSSRASYASCFAFRRSSAETMPLRRSRASLALVSAASTRLLASAASTWAVLASESALVSISFATISAMAARASIPSWVSEVRRASSAW
mmetsp:Transcript_46727/g.111245  ORF Transcript_46727/g.111245 Transcript_46727/m.111245 type:complete len:315 (+) Transcript_46727:803-1747(+)